MKKKFITILSLILAFVLCFALVACGGDTPSGGGNITPGGSSENGDGGEEDKKPSGGEEEEKPDAGTTVSVTLDDAYAAIDGILSAEGVVGTVSYTLSTKNTDPLTDGISFDKRGSKIKVTVGDDERIVDYSTGYVYYKDDSGYAFDQALVANTVDYVMYALSGVKAVAADKGVNAVYDEKAQTVTYVLESADEINKYIDPFLKAYKNGTTNIGQLLNEYCDLLFGKNFDTIFGSVKKYIADDKNTVGTVLDALKSAGIDVEAILEMTGYGLPDDQMNHIKARPLNKALVGVYSYLMSMIEDIIPIDAGEIEPSEDDEEMSGDGMQSIFVDLLNYMLFEDFSDEQVSEGLHGMSAVFEAVKILPVRTVTDMVLMASEDLADLSVAITKGVKVKNATLTVTVQMDDGKNITDVKVDRLVAHTYTGNAVSEGSLLADNDYRATVEVAISEYKTKVDDFDITFGKDAYYNHAVNAYVYSLDGKDVSVYYETAGEELDITAITSFRLATPDGDETPLTPQSEVVKFDDKTSSFVFDGKFVADAFKDAAYGTELIAFVYFEGEPDFGWGITLTYVNDDPEEFYGYIRNEIDGFLDEIIGDIAPTPPHTSEYDGTYN